MEKILHQGHNKAKLNKFGKIQTKTDLLQQVLRLRLLAEKKVNLRFRFRTGFVVSVFFVGTASQEKDRKRRLAVSGLVRSLSKVV